MNGQILINKNNLTHNLSEIQKYAKDSKIMSVIKSNGKQLYCRAYYFFSGNS